jgi:hypothetical protein
MAAKGGCIVKPEDMKGRKFRAAELRIVQISRTK